MNKVLNHEPIFRLPTKSIEFLAPPTHIITKLLANEANVDFMKLDLSDTQINRDFNEKSPYQGGIIE